MKIRNFVPSVTGFRPSSILEDKGGLKVIFWIVEALGANTLLHCQIASTRESVTVSMSGVRRIDFSLESQHFSVHPEYIHLFDPASGMMLAG